MANDFGGLKEQCVKTLDHYKKELSRLRSGRASTALLEGIHVEYYGSATPLQQLGLVSSPEARLLTIQVYDSAAVESIEKAIYQADLGLVPSREGTLIRVVVPALNEERRKDLIKKIHKMAEETKVSLRGHRRDAVELLKKRAKAKEVTEDDSRRGQDEIQKILDKYMVDVDTLTAGKEKELMEV